MKFLEIKVGKSINPNTGESWWKADTRVSLEEGESPDEVFKQVRDRIDGWLPNPFPQMEDTYSSVIPKKKMDIIVLKQYEDAIKRKDEKTITELLKHYDVTA